MNYEFFSNIFRALMSAGAVAVKIGDQDLLAKTEKAKASVLAQFDNFFPTSVRDMLQRPNPDCKPLLAIMAEFPELLQGRESKFLRFIADIVRYQAVYGKGAKISLDVNVLKIVSSSIMDDYAWKISKDTKKSEEFSNGILAVLPFLSEHPIDGWEMNFIEALLPAWGQAFPEISEALRFEFEKRKNEIRSECWV